MKIPKQKFNFVTTKKDEPHTEEEMSFVVENQNFMDVESYKSIKNKKDKYIVQLEGWSYDVETIDDAENAIFNNSQVFYKTLNFYGGIDRMDWNNFEKPVFVKN